MRCARVHALMNDVDVSLRELRDLERRRLDEEEAARVAELAARTAAEQARKAAEEAAMLARRRQLEEDAIRVREVEARVQAEAMIRIEAERLACEVELRRAALAVRQPRWMIGLAAGLAAVALLVGGLAWQARGENARRAAELRDANAEIEAATARLREAIEAERALRLDVATYRDELDRTRAAAAELQRRLAAAIGKQPVPPPSGKPRPPKAVNDGGNPPPPIKVCTDQVLCD